MRPDRVITPLGAIALTVALAGATLVGCKARARAPEAPEQVGVVRDNADPGLEMWSWLVSDERVARRSTNAPGLVRRAQSRADTPRTGAAPDSPPRDPDARDKPPAEPAPLAVSIVDQRVSIEVALAPYLDRPLPLPPERAARWRAAGFRLVSVPVVDLPRIESRTRLVGMVQRQWLGVVPIWTELARGPELREATLAALDDGPRVLPRGRPRMLARAFPVPVAGGAQLRVELVPQVAIATSTSLRALEQPRTPSELGEGTLMSLLSSMILPRGEALLVVPDAPDADWSALSTADGMAPPPTRDSAQSPPPSDPLKAGDAVPFAAPHALGPMMLDQPSEDRAARVRLVLVLIPHEGEGVRLLPDADPAR